MLRLLTKAEVVDLTGLACPTLWTLIRRGAFPAAIKVIDSKVRWRADEIKAWLASRPRQKLKGIPAAEANGKET